MEKRNPTQSPLPPLIDFLQIYTIHEYIYIYTCMYMLFIFSATLLGVLWPAQTMTPVAANRNRSWNTERQKEQAKRRLKPAAFFIVKAEARGPKRECYAPSRTMRACVRVYPTDTYIQILVHLYQPLRRALNLASWINLRRAMHDDIDVDACIWRIHWTSA